MKHSLSNNTPRPKGSYYVAKAWAIVFILSLANSCKSSYRHLQKSNADVHCIEQFAPKFSNTLYSAYVDVTKHHFSGLLFFKLMPDSSMRIVFTNEVGVKFFDFAFTKDQEFIKYYALKKLNKKVVINALKNDLRIVLLHPDYNKAKALQDSTYTYISFPDKSGHDYYLTDHCNSLVRIEKSSKRKPVVVTQMLDYKNCVPDSIDIQHKNFKFTIALKRVER
jgi:hypothetical protein